MSEPPINLFEYEARAQAALPSDRWDYIAGGVLDEKTVAWNRDAFDAIKLRMRTVRDVSERQLSTTVLGTPISLPVMLAPAGAHTLAHPGGEVETARGAGLSDTLMVVAVQADCSLESVADAATGPIWFQTKYFGKALTSRLVERAEAAGYSALVLTVDSVANLAKERDVRSGLVNPASLGMGLANFAKSATTNTAGFGTALPAALPLTWEIVEWLRAQTSLPLVLKGITTHEDTELAVEHGIDAIIVSNHGGRVLDTMPAAIECLPEVVAAANDALQVYLDSGIRRGTDVLKALALGARAVAIGRPQFWGLTVSGAQGVHHVIELLRAELDGALACCGQTSVTALEAGVVAPPTHVRVQ